MVGYICKRGRAGRWCGGELEGVMKEVMVVIGTFVKDGGRKYSFPPKDANESKRRNSRNMFIKVNFMVMGAMKDSFQWC